MVDESGLRICPECGDRFEAAREGQVCEKDGAALLDELSLEMRAECPALGRVVGEKYVVVGMLGKGGFGAVYRAVQMPVRRSVAVKLIRGSGHADDAQRRSRFFREARLVANMRDPASVTLHDYGEEADGTMYMVFELIDGLTLEAIIQAGPLPADRTVQLLVQILRSLAEAHSMGVLHRDLKPGNVMVQADALGGETARVLDFGIAKSYLGKSETSLSDVTTEDVVVGTPRYMAPEQARNLALDQRTDLYATGVLAYAMLTGKPPFDGSNAMTVLMAHLQEAPPPIAEALGVPEAVQAVLLKAMSKAPEDRYQSAEEMVRALTEAVPGTGMSSSNIRAVPTGTPLAAFDETMDAAGISSQVIAAESLALEQPKAPNRSGVILVALVIVGLLTWVALPKGDPDPGPGSAAATAPPAPDAAPPPDAAPKPQDAAPKPNDAAPKPQDAAAKPNDTAREPRKPEQRTEKPVKKPERPVKKPDTPAKKPDPPAKKPDPPKTLEVPEF